jgi:hypothetical protein
VSGARRYAAKTAVPVARSRAEIEQLLQRYGAQQFVSGWDTLASRHVIGFSVETDAGLRQVRLRLPLPKLEEFVSTRAHEQETRRVWRAMALVVKSKLEAVESGISTIEREFLADIVLPDGTLIGDWTAPQLAAAYSSGKMPRLLPGGGG